MVFADRSLATRLEGLEVACVLGFADSRRRIDPDADTEAIEIAGGRAFYFGADSPLTEAKGIGMHGPVTSDEIVILERVFHDRGVAARVIVCPLADPSLLEGLASRGFRAIGFEDVLYRTLDRSESFPDPPASMTIEWTGPDDFELAARTLARGFAAPDEPAASLLDIMLMSARNPGMHGLLARIDGEPAGAASLFLHGDLAMLCGASTLPEFRGRGIQTALAHARLVRAASSGCQLISIGGAPGSTSHRNAERLGFRVAYTKLLLGRDPIVTSPPS